VQKCLGILNNLGNDHQCDGWTDGRTDGRGAAVNNSAIDRPALKWELIGCTESHQIKSN